MKDFNSHLALKKFITSSGDVNNITLNIARNPNIHVILLLLMQNNDEGLARRFLFFVKLVVYINWSVDIDVFFFNRRSLKACIHET